MAVAGEGDVYTNQDGASKYCSELGKRLPTIRELAGIRALEGAKGILEMDQVDSNNIPLGYDPIWVVNADGSKDSFYFSDEGFAHPRNDRFWSSSKRIDNPYGDYNGVFLSGFYGISSTVLVIKNTPVCVQ